VAGLLVGALVLAARPAQARTPVADAIELHWDAPTACPGADRVREHARRRMGAADTSAVVARGTVRSIDASTWILELTLEGEAGDEHREIRAASCEALAEAAGLLIAVAADPSRAPEGPAFAPESAPAEPASTEPAPTKPTPPHLTPPPPTPPEPAPPQPVVTPDPVPTAPSPRRRSIDGAIRAELGGQFLRVLPLPNDATFGGALALRLPSARVELRGRYALAQRVADATQRDAGGTIDLWTLGAAGCYAPRWRRLEFPICAGVELGAMRGRSFGVTDDGSARTLFVALPIDANLVWAPIPRVGLLAGTGVSATLRRPSFHLRGLDPLFVAGPVALRLVVGVEVRFP
jgi:hypothetical protein